MHKKILSAAALGLALLPAFADNIPPPPAADALQGGAIMQANLVVSPQPVGAPRASEAAALKGSLASNAEQAALEAESERHHTTGMLLAALALMAGIALRRWGDGEQ